MPLSQEAKNSLDTEKATKLARLISDRAGYDQKQKEREEHLRTISKSLDELVVSEKFHVDSVTASLTQNYIGPSNPVFGKSYTPTKIGVTPYLVLDVTSLNQEVPVRKLSFDGISSVIGDVCIEAKIPRFKEETVYGGYEKLSFYVDRDFGVEERAIELILLSSEETILRRDRAVDYNHFLKQ